MGFGEDFPDLNDSITSGYKKLVIQPQIRDGVLCMLAVIYTVLIMFLVFYLLNYLGQKLISKGRPINHSIIVVISFIEAIIGIVLAYYKPPFL